MNNNKKQTKNNPNKPPPKKNNYVMESETREASVPGASLGLREQDRAQEKGESTELGRDGREASTSCICELMSVF